MCALQDIWRNIEQWADYSSNMIDGDEYQCKGVRCITQCQDIVSKWNLVEGKIYRFCFWCMFKEEQGGSWANIIDSKVKYCNGWNCFCQIENSQEQQAAAGEGDVYDGDACDFISWKEVNIQGISKRRWDWRWSKGNLKRLRDIKKSRLFLRIAESLIDLKCLDCERNWLCCLQ